MSESYTIKNGGQETEVTLLDLAGLDMETVEANDGSFEATPKGTFIWNVVNAALEEVAGKPTIQFELECIGCAAVLAEGKTPDDMIGWKHKETIFINDAVKSIGQAKGLMVAAGLTQPGTLQNMLDAFCDMKFVSNIKHRKDKEDKDKIYANIDIKSVTPYVPAAA